MVDDVEEGRVNSCDCGWQTGRFRQSNGASGLDFRNSLYSNCGAIAIAVDMMCCLKFLLKQ